jgi:hypothetical protein
MGEAGRDAPQRRELGGEFVASVTWAGLTIGTPGTFTLAAEARDVRYAEPASGYPHTTGEHSAAPTVELTVVERSDAVSR